MSEPLEQSSDFLRRNLLVHAWLGVLGLERCIERALVTESTARTSDSELDYAILGLLRCTRRVRAGLSNSLAALPTRAAPSALTPPATIEESLLR